MALVFERGFVRGGIFTWLFWSTAQWIHHFAARLAPVPGQSLAQPEPA